MTPPLRLHLRDISHSLVEAWRQEFAGLDGVTISRGDIFSEREGQVSPKDPIDIRADAIISPANSFGFTDGGIDAVYTYQLGQQVQDRLRELLEKDWGGELPVGNAVLVPTGREEIPWCISAPTMRVPTDVSETVNAYLAMRASLRCVLAYNKTAKTPIRTILTPGLGTAVGRMPALRCARQMKDAWLRTVVGPDFIPGTLRAAATDDARLKP